MLDEEPDHICLEVLKVLVRLSAPEHTPDEKGGKFSAKKT